MSTVFEPSLPNYQVCKWPKSILSRVALTSLSGVHVLEGELQFPLEFLPGLLPLVERLEDLWWHPGHLLPPPQQVGLLKVLQLHQEALPVLKPEAAVKTSAAQKLPSEQKMGDVRTVHTTALKTFKTYKQKKSGRHGDFKPKTAKKNRARNQQAE